MEPDKKAMKDQQLPQDFDFALYILKLGCTQVSHMIHLGLRSWIVLAIALVVLFEAEAWLPSLGNYLLHASGVGALLVRCAQQFP